MAGAAEGPNSCLTRLLVRKHQRRVSGSVLQCAGGFQRQSETVVTQLSGKPRDLCNALLHSPRKNLNASDCKTPPEKRIRKTGQGRVTVGDGVARNHPVVISMSRRSLTHVCLLGAVFTVHFQ